MEYKPKGAGKGTPEKFKVFNVKIALEVTLPLDQDYYFLESGFPNTLEEATNNLPDILGVSEPDPTAKDIFWELFREWNLLEGDFSVQVFVEDTGRTKNK